MRGSRLPGDGGGRRRWLEEGRVDPERGTSSVEEESRGGGSSEEENVGGRGRFASASMTLYSHRWG